MPRLKHMTSRTKLPMAGPSGIGQPTAMSREVAAHHGVPYVNLMALAIDLDRVHEHIELDEAYGMGWEVYLLMVYLRQQHDPEQQESSGMIEDACVVVMERSEDGPVLGASLPFAVYALVQQQAWPNRWPILFASWQGSQQLLAALHRWHEGDLRCAALAEACLRAGVDPPLSAPARTFLESLASG